MGPAPRVSKGPSGNNPITEYVGSGTASMELDCIGILDDQRIRAANFPNGREFDEIRCKTSAKAANDHSDALSVWRTASTASKNITAVLSLGMKRLSRDEPKSTIFA